MILPIPGFTASLPWFLLVGLTAASIMSSGTIAGGWIPLHEIFILNHFLKDDVKTVIQDPQVHLHPCNYKITFSLPYPFERERSDGLTAETAILRIRQVHFLTVWATECLVCRIHDILHPLLIVSVVNTTTTPDLQRSAEYEHLPA